MAAGEDERQAANVPLLVMTGVTFAAIVGVYAWSAAEQNRIFKAALADLAARRPYPRRRVPVISTTPEPSNEEVAADEH